MTTEATRKRDAEPTIDKVVLKREENILTGTGLDINSRIAKEMSILVWWDGTIVQDRATKNLFEYKLQAARLFFTPYGDYISGNSEGSIPWEKGKGELEKEMKDVLKTKEMQDLLKERLGMLYEKNKALMHPEAIRWVEHLKQQDKPKFKNLK